MTMRDPLCGMKIENNILSLDAVDNKKDFDLNPRMITHVKALNTV